MLCKLLTIYCIVTSAGEVSNSSSAFPFLRLRSADLETCITIPEDGKPRLQWGDRAAKSLVCEAVAKIPVIPRKLLDDVHEIMDI